MVISYRLSPKNSCVITKIEGSLTFEDLVRYLMQIVDDPNISSEHITLFDASDVNNLEITPVQMEEFTSMVKSRYAERAARKMAIITRGDKETELADYYECLASSFGESAMVFYNYDVACKWLGIPPDA